MKSFMINEIFYDHQIYIFSIFPRFADHSENMGFRWSVFSRKMTESVKKQVSENSHPRVFSVEE